MRAQFLVFIKKYKKLLACFLIGILLLCIYNILYNSIDYGSEINPGIRSLAYCGFLFLFISLFLFFLRAKRTIVYNILFTFILILLLEITCFFLLGMPPAIKKKFNYVDLPPDHIGRNIGDVPYSDSIYHSVLITNQDTAYDVKYTIDHFCKRSTPGYNASKKKHCLFFGCSIAFGVGLNDDQTFPYCFQTESTEYNSYNYALSGHGTNHMLARLQFQDLSKQVTEKEGAAFYIFFWDHIPRSIGSMDRYCSWVFNSPYYKIENGHLIRKKFFKDGRPVISKFYELVYQTNIVKYFKLDFPVRLNDNHFDLVTEIINESKKEYQKQFGKNDFYCVIYPNEIRYTPEEMKRFKYFLSKKHIDCIDLSEFITYDHKYTLGGDPHPNANTNKILAKELMNRYLKMK